MNRRNRLIALDLAVFAAALALYWLTLSPGVLPADAGEFQLVGARLGIAHPPGYPLYTMLARVFVTLMPHDPARAINLFSAVTAALTVTVSGRAVRHVTGSAVGGLSAAVTLAVTSSFWVTGTQASIRPLTAFFTALCAERLAAYRANPTPSAIFGFGLAAGLGLTHHPSLAFPGVFFAIFLLMEGVLTRRQHMLLAVGGLALGFLPWVYLPLRGAMPDVLLAPPGIATWGGFWEHVLARGFAGDLFAFRTPTELADRLRVLGNILLLQWNPLLLAAGLIAAGAAVWRDWRTALMLGGGALLHSAITMTYRAPQTVEYLNPAYVLLAILLGVGAGVMGRLRPRLDQVAVLPVLLGAVLLATANWPSLRALAVDTSTRAYAESVLAAAGDEVLAPWHWATPMWYLQQVEGQQPEVEVTYVFPEGAEPLAETWAARLEAGSVLTGYYPTAFAGTGFTFEPLAAGPFSAWRVRSAPPNDLPPGFTPLDVRFDEGVRLLGVDAPESAASGDALHVRLAWHAPSGGVTGFLHLTTPDGRVLSADDVPLPPGEVVIVQYTLGVPYGDPGTQLMAGAYTRDDAGAIVPLLTQGAPRTTLTELPITARAQPTQGTPLGGGIILREVNVSPAEGMRPGDEVIVDLTFYAARPLLTDRIIKVDVVGPGFAWRVQSDHVPAEGAVPTLKWLTGWVIHDRHRLTIPAGVETSGATLELLLYDHFTNEVTPILDPQLAQQGITVTIHRWP